jgi:Ran GTPase-activating protein (RanGAP) involved in mRNA processing and transport
LASLAITSAGPITGPLLRQLLGDAPRLARLRVLDLSNGELDDGDADRLAARHRDLDHLERLDLSNTGLSDTARSRLGSTLTRIAVLLL